MPEEARHRFIRRRAVWAALLHKEWCEQRWRFFLATIVVSGLLAGSLRAQIVSSVEAEVLIYGPVGLILAIFFAAGPVSGERADRTWEFLAVQPVSRSEIILSKWAIGALLLAGTMAISTVAGLAAMWSRGIRMMPHVYEYYGERSPDEFATWSTTHPALALCIFGAVATITLICWFTPLYLILTRAQNEFAATLGGVFLTIAAVLWLAVVEMELVTHGGQTGIAPVSLLASLVAGIAMAILNPLSPFVLVTDLNDAAGLPLAAFTGLCVWVVLPLWWTCRNSGRVIGKWVKA
jgi:ABC-type Na+ efflux pump permease subunit